MLDKDTQYACSQMHSNNAVWILKDNDGCVMLTTEDEDGVPVWSECSLAEAWVNEDWQGCKAYSIELQTWYQKWTQGLIKDQLAVMINPSEFQEEGVVLSPEEFEQALKGA